LERLRTIVEQYCSTANCSTAVLSRFPTSVSLTLLSRNPQTRLASSAGGRLGTTVEQWTIEDNRRTMLFNGKLFNGCPQPFSDKLQLGVAFENSQTRLASSAGGRLGTIVEQYCSTANCSTAVLSRFPTSVSLALLSRTLRLASQARQEGGWGQPSNNGRLRTIVEQCCSTANCSTAVLSRFPTSVSLTLLSRTLRLASQARHRDD